MGSSEIVNCCSLYESGQNLLKRAIQKLSIPARAYGRIIKIACAIADLDNSENIKTEYLAEAIQYRSLDRESWGS
ncbi:MAG: hypothetical protein QM503_01305 [Bacteroidota bacterium]